MNTGVFKRLIKNWVEFVLNKECKLITTNGSEQLIFTEANCCSNQDLNNNKVLRWCKLEYNYIYI